jgi:cysteine desulfurase/selenocysteine lyase
MTRRVVYLDNASTSWPKPACVASAMEAFLREGAATPGRGAYAMAAEAGRAVSRLRRRLAALIGSPDPERMILGTSATDGLNTAILGLFEDAAAGPPARVVTTPLEHNSVSRPLHYLRARGVVEVVAVDAGPDGFVRAADVLDAADERTVLVAVTAASNVLGTIQPVGGIGRALRARAPRALFLVDACQSIGLVPVDVQRDAIDLLAFSGHKALLGPSGTGALYVSPRAWPGDGTARPLSPTRFGGTGVDSASPDMPRVLPARFEAGTPNTVGLVGLLAALEDPSRPPAEAALAHERAMIDRLLDAIRDVPRVRPVGPRDRSGCVGVLSLVIDGMAAEEAAAALDASFGIAVRAGLHCAPGAHRAAGTLELGGTLRVSPGPFTTAAEIDLLVEALRALARA